MATDLAILHLADTDLQQIELQCAKHRIKSERLVQAAWLNTLVVYCAGANVATAVIHNSGSIGSVVANLKGTLTISQALTSLESRNSDGISIKDDLESTANGFANDFHYNGTLVGVVEDRESKQACDQLIKRFKTKAGGIIRACVVLNQHGELVLHCLRDSIPAYSPEALLDTFAAMIRAFSSSDETTPLEQTNVLGPLNQSILNGWTKTDFKRVDRCVHDLIEEYARAHPDKDAVVAMQGRGFTYGELSSISTSLANHLVKLGVKKGDIIPTLMEKSQFAILSVMAIMKAGAVYVGFSTESPVNFLRQCAQVAGVKIICTLQPQKNLVVQIGCNPLVVDDDLIADLSTPMPQALPTVYPSDLLYLVFTSGSTGTPKAVMNEHGPYAGCALAQMEYRLLDETRRVLQFSSYNFDAINGEIFSPLIAGATICVPTEHARLNSLPKAINDLKVNYMGLVPTLAKVLDPKTVPGLKVFTMAGEPIGQALVKQWMSSPGLDVINVYGPGECCMDTTANIYTRHTTQENNIGKAFDGICGGHIVNVNNHNQLLPVGALGELLIQGSTLGRGYLGEPEKTAQAYISNPTWLSPDTSPEYRRLYKTGDMMRQNPDQSFLTYSRIDKQVKLNGQRMELGEIEYNTAKALGGDCKVAVELIKLPWRHEVDSKILIAFYSCNAGWHKGRLEALIDSEAPILDAELIMKKLLDDLKPIAIPRAFIPLKLMPAVTQGKLDRKTLQALGAGLSKETFSMFAGDVGTGEPIRTDSERVVQGLFAYSLGVAEEQIARDSNFFWLGGDSIRAMKLIALAQKQGLQLSVPDVLQNPKLHELARLIEKQGPGGQVAYTSFDSIKDREDKHEIIAAAVKATECEMEKDMIEDIVQATDYQSSCIAWTTLEKRGALNWLVCDFTRPQREEQVRELCDSLIKRHPILRTGFFLYKRVIYQAVIKKISLPISTCLYEADLEERRRRIVEEGKRRTVDIGKPQTAFILLGMDGGNGIKRLLIRVSHAQYDGQSMGILSSEMRSFLDGRALSEIAGTFAGYFHLSRAWELETGVAYWRSLLQGAEMTKIVQRNAPVFLDLADSASVRLISTQLLKAPRGLSKATSVKTAWALTLSSLTGNDDVVFGSTVWGRNAPVPYAHQIIGSTLSHIPTRANCTTGKTYANLMKALQEQHLESMRFENLGANTIVELCTSWKRWTRLSSLVVYQGLEIDAQTQMDKDCSTESLGVSISEIIDPADRTDLLLHVEPKGNETTVVLRYCRRKIPEKVAELAMEKFTWYLARLTQQSDSLIESHGNVAEVQLPVIYVDTYLNGTDGNISNDSNLGDDTSNTSSKSDYFKAVKTVWQHVFALGSEEVDQHDKEDSQFLNIWGNIVSAAGLATTYKERGFNVSTEDMLRNQRVKDQANLLRQVDFLKVGGKTNS